MNVTDDGDNRFDATWWRLSWTNDNVFRANFCRRMFAKNFLSKDQCI